MKIVFIPLGMANPLVGNEGDFDGTPPNATYQVMVAIVVIDIVTLCLFSVTTLLGNILLLNLLGLGVL